MCGLILLLGIGMARAAETDDRYNANETVFDAFGTATVGQQTIDHFSSSRVRHDARLGAGLGLSYFATRNFGVAVDAYSESVQHSLVDSTSASLIFRLPLGSSGFAPYAFGGGGRQFDLNDLWFGQVGGGIEYRFTPKFGVFVDARYVLPERTQNYGLMRAGVRLSF